MINFSETILGYSKKAINMTAVIHMTNALSVSKMWNPTNHWHIYGVGDRAVPR